MIDSAKTTVVLVHGFQTTAVFLGSSRPYNCEWLDMPLPYEPGMHSDFDHLPDWLMDDGFKDIRLTGVVCNSRQAPAIERCSEAIRKQILSVVREAHDREIVIFAHSLGGLIVRAYLESPLYAQDTAEIGRSFVNCVFTLGTPHRAMTFNTMLQLNLNSNSVDTYHPIAGEFSSRKRMDAFNRKYAHVSGIDYYAIGGTGYSGFLGNIIGTYIHLTWGANDGTVPLDSAVGMVGAKQTAVVNASHVSKVGKPAYFYPARGEQQTPTYIYCVRPVLFGQGSMDVAHLEPVTPKLKLPYVLPTILAFGFIYLVSTVRWGFRVLHRVLNRRKLERVTTAP